MGRDPKIPELSRTNHERGDSMQDSSSTSSPNKAKGQAAPDSATEQADDREGQKEKKASGRNSGTKNSNARKSNAKNNVTAAGEVRVGARFSPHFVAANENPYTQVKWVQRSSQISDAEGQKVFSMDSVEVPEGWSQLATDIAVSKYFRKAGVPGSGHEMSVRQLVHRIAHTIREAGESLADARGGYFATSQDAEQFEKELVYLLLHQMAAFNSPVWFNCGLHQEYGIMGSGGNWRWDAELERPVMTTSSYEYPQCSACFIQSVDDDLMSIFDLARNEARIFKYGSGTGTNFSKIRGAMEKLSGGGLSSGLMSFLEVLDRGAGATKSGGTTRRAAKMVCLDMDHPEISDFISWKMREERKVGALVDAGYSSDFNGDAYKTVAGQNSNNSVRISDEFMAAVARNGEWQTTARVDGQVIATYKARDLWDQVATAAWHCADPGVQFDSTIQKWHTCANTDRINGSNPCSEYMFLDDSACNLSSLNLVKFLRDDGSFDLLGYRHACRVMLTAQEILVDFSSYPTEKIARNSHDFRPLGLGYANLGTLLMIKGIAYDSPEARAWASVLTAIMHGEAYRTSSEIAAHRGPFPQYAENADVMMRVTRQHQAALDEIASELIPQDLLLEAYAIWNDVIANGDAHGFRNAQATVLAPTGTIGLLMDCDTTGIEPDFALVKFKKLAGGGYFKIVNQSVTKALKTLSYTEKQIREIVAYAVGTMSLENSPHIHLESLRKKGLNDIDFAKISDALPGAFDLKAAISPWVLGDEGLGRLGFTRQSLGDREVLEVIGFTAQQIREASYVVCGRMTVEGAPFLRQEHLAIFDCANKCGADGKRFIQPRAHIQMMAAAQPFISGAISKTVNLPFESTIADIEALYSEAWRLGVKAVAVYRDGSKLSQPLNGKSQSKERSAENKLPENVAVFTEALPPVNTRGERLEFSQRELEDAVAQALRLAPARKRKMPQKRNGLTVEARVGGHQIFLRSGEYDDGRLGEIFIDMHKEGATLRSLLNCFAISVSMGLQYGVPLEDYVEKFTFTRFEPQGMVDHPNIKTATSLLDYIFRVLGMEYLGKTDFVHVKPAAEDLVVHQRGAESVVDRPRHANVERNQLDLSLERAVVPGKAAAGPDSLNTQLSKLMGDAPMCSTCGHVTVRNGSCYRCMNCGTSMGCS